LAPKYYAEVNVTLELPVLVCVYITTGATSKYFHNEATKEADVSDAMIQRVYDSACQFREV